MIIYHISSVTDFRQDAARQDRGDYYKCDTCGGLFSRYHNAYKQHVQLCKARNRKLRDEEARVFVERYTLTPKPFLHACSLGELSQISGNVGRLHRTVCECERFHAT